MARGSFLKKVLLGSLVFVFSLMGNEPSMFSEEPGKAGIKSAIQDLKDDLIEEWNFLPYLQMEWVAPGVGMCVRSPGLPLKWEMNVKGTWVFLGYFGAMSISALYAKPARNGAVYFGWGGGVFAMESFHGSHGWEGIDLSPLVNLFFGYEGRSGFFDLGVDFVRFEGEAFSAAPTFRYGWKF